jgi:polyisoprenoid-binding protein YceI
VSAPRFATSRRLAGRAIRAAASAVAVLATAPGAHAQDRAAGGPAPPATTYTILPAATVLEVHTYRAGLLGGLGHEHDIRAHAFTGTVVYDAADPSRSRVALTVLTDSLRVVPAGDSADIPAITKAMREHVLDVARFPEISFASTDVTVGGDTVHLRGNLTMVGVTRPVELDLALDVTPTVLHVSGWFAAKQTDFGIHPYSAGLGTVKVKNEVTFRLDVRAVATP